VLYKVVKENGTDHHTGKIKYENEVICPDWNPNENIQCGNGLHLSPTKAQALSYHQGKVLRCAVKPKDFVIYQGDFSKVRCRRVMVLGEVK